MIHFKEPQQYFHIKTWKVSTNSFKQLYAGILFYFLPASFFFFFFCTVFVFQHVDINELCDYQVWKYNAVIYNSLLFN